MYYSLSTTLIAPFFHRIREVIIPTGSIAKIRKPTNPSIMLPNPAIRATREIAETIIRTGKTPLIPRFALGNWWSRYWRYSDEELLQLMTRFETEEIPL